MDSKIDSKYIDNMKKHLDKYDLSDENKKNVIIIILSICDHYIDDAFNGPSIKCISDRYEQLKIIYLRHLREFEKKSS